MEIILLLPLIFGFLVVLFLTPFWIRKAKEVGLMWEDMNKFNPEKNVAGSGGVSVFLAFLLGTMTYLAIRTFYFKSEENLIEIFAFLGIVSIIGFIGFIDDILGWRRGGLAIKSRLILLLFASIPLIIVNSGTSEIIGINVGLFYPLILVPLAVVGVASTFNFLAGYNGLETSQGVIILSALSLITFIKGDTWISIVGLIMVFCLMGFYIFNKYPAKVFPGDILTYCIGAMIAGIAIIGRIELIAFFFFIPYILETILKSRGKLKKQSFGKVNEDGSLEVPYEKIYGLEHLAIFILKKIKPSKKVYEQDVVYLINLFQILIIAVGFLIFRGAIFI